VIGDRLEVRLAKVGEPEERHAEDAEQGRIVGAEYCLGLGRHPADLSHDPESESDCANRQEDADELHQLEKRVRKGEAWRWSGWYAGTARPSRRSNLLSRLRECSETGQGCSHYFSVF
jgi:hypothetical protein